MAVKKTVATAKAEEKGMEVKETVTEAVKVAPEADGKVLEAKADVAKQESKPEVKAEPVVAKKPNGYVPTDYGFPIA